MDDKTLTPLASLWHSCSWTSPTVAAVAITVVLLSGCSGVPPTFDVTWSLEGDELRITVRVMTRIDPGLPIEIGLRPTASLPEASSVSAPASGGSISHTQMIPFAGESVSFRAFAVQEEVGSNGYLNRYLDYEAEIVVGGQGTLVSCETPEPPAWPTITRSSVDSTDLVVAITQPATIHVSGARPSEDPLFEGPGSRTYSNASWRPVSAVAWYPAEVYAPSVVTHINLEEMVEGVHSHLREPKTARPFACSFSI